MPSPENPENWQMGDRVKIKAPGRWADGRIGVIDTPPKVGRYIPVRVPNGRSTAIFPAASGELERIK